MQEQVHFRYYRLPRNVFEQILLQPDQAEKNKKMENIFTQVQKTLVSHRISLYNQFSNCRVKSNEDIQEKTKRRGNDDPILDIYGLRFVVDDADKKRVIQVIKQNFLLTPELPRNKPNIRDYSDDTTRRLIIQNFNPNFGYIYTAIHINIFFGEGPVSDIAEIQIMNPKELTANQKQRHIYKNK